MKTCQIALKKVQDYFAKIGFTIIVVPVEAFSNPKGWRGPHGKLREEWSIKIINRTTVEVSDEVSLGFLIHEAMHLIIARPAWDETVSGDVYNWSKKVGIVADESPIIIFGRNLLTTLNIQEEAIQSARHFDPEPPYDGYWKQPGGDLLTHDSLGRPNEERMLRSISYLMKCGVADVHGNLIGFFNPEIAKNFSCITLGLEIEDGSPLSQMKIAA